MGMSMSGPWCFSAPVGMHTVQRGWLDRGSVLRGGAGLLSSGVHEARTPQSGASKDIHTTQSVQSGARKYGRSPILSLGPGLVRAVFVRRPSERNKSPYVGDVQLEDGGRVALAHMPSMGMGGKVKEGSEVLLKVAVDAKGRPVGANATGKWNTPKCEFIMQVRVPTWSHDAPRNLQFVQTAKMVPNAALCASCCASQSPNHQAAVW